MKKRKENFLKREYRLSWDYLKESRNFIYAIIGVFFVFGLIGFLFPVFFVEEILSFIEKLLEQTKDLNQWQMIRFILFNNLESSFFGLILGLFFGIFPVIFSLINGYVLGFVASATVREEGFFILWRLLPHGIFELPAVFISLGLGLKFGTFIFMKKKGESFVNFFWSGLRVFICIVVPLLIIAAIIEGVLIFAFG